MGMALSEPREPQKGYNVARLGFVACMGASEWA